MLYASFVQKSCRRYSNSLDLLHVLIKQVQRRKVSNLHFLRLHKHAALIGAGEISLTAHASVVLSRGFIEFNTNPERLGILGAKSNRPI